VKNGPPHVVTLYNLLTSKVGPRSPCCAVLQACVGRAHSLLTRAPSTALQLLLAARPNRWSHTEGLGKTLGLVPVTA